MRFCCHSLAYHMHSLFGEDKTVSISTILLEKKKKKKKVKKVKSPLLAIVANPLYSKC